MSSPEVESFEITDQDLLNEFNPERHTYQQTKHQATYGIWADDSDEDDRPAFGKKKKKGPDYTASLNFVSGGVKVGDKVTKEKVEGEEEDDGVEPDSDEEPTLVPKQFSGKKGYARKGVMNTNRNQEGDGIGTWEKHTRGIGMKLLQQMGHVKGKGLGKRSQGISTPVEAMKRKGKGAVGYHGTERTERSKEDYPIEKSLEEKQDEQFTEDIAQWKKGQIDRKKKVKYRYKTADELIATGSSGKKLTRKEKQSELAKVKVIDMTRKEQRVLSGYHALAHKHDRPEDDEPVIKTTEEDKKPFEMRELMHNLDLLVDMSEEAIITNDRKTKYEGDLMVNLTYEKTRTDDICNYEEKQIDTLKDVLGLIESYEQTWDPFTQNPQKLTDCAILFKKLMTDYYEEYKLFELSSLSVALVFPLIKQHFIGWDPLKTPRHGIPIVQEWKSVLEGMGQPLLHEQYMDPYDRLIWEVWMPHIRPVISTRWKVRDCDALLEVIEAWLPILPNWILSNVLEQLIFPRLQAEVESWNPLTDTMPIHAWLHPWLPFMGDRLEPLYGPIRHKLANALTNWHPSDNSAKLILAPWNKVFNPSHLDAFLVKNIVPKLSLCMSEFLINPHEQHLDGWNCVMGWMDMVPKQYMVTILDKHFFPKWLKVLIAWLTSNPNYEEVTKWYRGWKSMFPDALLTDSTIKEHFNEALSLMNRAVTGLAEQPGARENVAYLASQERRRDYQTKSAYERREYDTIRGANAVGSVASSFRELVEKRAGEYGILFAPLTGKFREARQIYKFGDLTVYFDRNVVFLCEPATGKWVPVSLNTLIDRAKQS